MFFGMVFGMAVLFGMVAVMRFVVVLGVMFGMFGVFGVLFGVVFDMFFMVLFFCMVALVYVGGVVERGKVLYDFQWWDIGHWQDAQHLLTTAIRCMVCLKDFMCLTGTTLPYYR